MVRELYQPSRDRLIGLAQQLPSTPRIMAGLGALLMDFNSELPAVGALLRQDLGLVARLIRMANSPFYTGWKVGTIEDALNRIGFGEVYRLVGFVVIEQMTPFDLFRHGISAGSFRNHSLALALASEKLASRFGADPRAAYMAGLVRTMGMVVFEMLCRETSQAWEGVSFVGSNHASMAAWQEHIFGMSYHAVCRITLPAWNFPEEIVAAAGGCSIGDMQSPLGAAVGLADVFVQSTPFHISGCGLPMNMADALGGLSRGDRDSLGDWLSREVQRLGSI